MNQLFAIILAFFFLSTALSAQDEPCSAILLECNTEPIIGDFDLYTYNPEYEHVQFFGTNCYNGSSDLWFSFTADGESAYLLYSADDYDSSFRSVISLYRGEECSALDEVYTCNRSEFFHEVFEAGQYYLLVREELSFLNDNYKVGLKCGSVSENDEICNATPLTCGEIVSGTFLGSFPEANSDICSLDRQPPKAIGDVWYSFIADSSITYSFFSNDDIQITIFYQDSCTGEFFQRYRGCIYDTGWPSLTGNGDIWVSVRPRAYDFRSTDDYTFGFVCNDLLPNAHPCQAELLESCDTTITGDILNGALTQTEFPYQVVLWYKYVPDFTGVLNISSPSGILSSLDLVVGDCNDSGFTQQEVWDNSDPAINAYLVEDGTEYLIRVNGFSDNFSQTEFSFSLSSTCENAICDDLGFIGSPCDDEDPNTVDEIITEDCECVGTQIFCPGLGEVGASCDTDNPTILNEVITSDCECVGVELVEGSLCENAIVVDQLPYFVEDLGTFDDNSTSHANNYGNTEALMSVILDNSEYYNCSFGAFDYVFRYTPEEDIVVDMEYMAIASLAYEPSIHLYKGCPFEEWIASSCAGPPSLIFCGSFFGCDYLYDRLDAVYLEGDEEYFIMIDGWNAEGPNHVFDFSISESAIIPGDFCQEAVELTPGLNWNDHYLEVDLADAHISGGTCTGLLSRPDKWFYVDALSTTMIAAVKGMDEFDPVIEAYTVCDGDPVRCKNNTGAGEIELVSSYNLQFGERYYLRVYDTRSFDPDNDQDFKISVRYADPDDSELTFDSSLSSLFEEEFQWDVCPNPNSGNELNLRVDHIPNFKEIIRFSIYDLVGRELKTELIRIDGSNFVFRMDIDDLTRGTYAVVATGEGGVQSSKILIIE